MAKGYGGKPVYGGTYPAQIWRDYVEAALAYYAHPGAATPRQTTVTSTGASGATGASSTERIDRARRASTSTGAGGATAGLADRHGDLARRRDDTVDRGDQRARSRR